MTVSINGTNGLVFQDGTTQGTAGFTGFRNVLYNGAFEVAQRGTTFNDGAGTHNQYGLDRWAQGQFQGGPQSRVAVTSPVAGMTARYACRISSSTTAQVAGGTRMALGQKVESINSIPLRGQVVSLSFWVRFSSATISSVSNTTNSNYGDWYAQIWYNSTTTDSTFASTGPDSYAVAPLGGTARTFANGSLPTTWTKVTVTVTAPTNLNNIGVRFNFDQLGNTSAFDGAWYEITEVQLESGNPTKFEWRPYGTELALCQRYYYKKTVNAQTFMLRPDGYRWCTVYPPVTLRVGPSISFTYQADGTGTSGQTDNVGVDSFDLRSASATAAASSNPYFQNVTASAEL